MKSIKIIIVSMFFSAACVNPVLADEAVFTSPDIRHELQTRIDMKLTEALQTEYSKTNLSYVAYEGVTETAIGNET